MSKKPIKNIFVVMPFVRVNGGSRSQAQLTSFYLNHIKRPIEGAQHLQHEYRVKRSGEAFSITRDIISELCRADIIIADLSGTEPNPNVMYELGVRLAISKDPVILIREAMPGTRNPFDVLVYFTKQYDPLDYSQLEEHLIGKLGRLETGEESFDNEVLRVIREELTLIAPDPTSISPDRQRTSVLRGMKMLGDTIEAAYGPLGLGRQVLTSASSSSLAVTGKEIVRTLKSKNLFEQEGIRFLGQAALSFFDKFEDGSKQVILMTTAMIEAASEGSDNQSNASVADELALCAEKIVERLHQSAVATTPQDWTALATTAAKLDRMPSQLCEAIDILMKGGFVSIEDSSEQGLRTAHQEHYTVSRGAMHEDFLFEENQTKTTLRDALVLISPQSVESLRLMLPILEKIAKTNRPLLLVAPKIEGELLETLRVNNSRGTLMCVPVVAPGFGYRQIGMLHDLAAVTGATVLEPEKGFSISNAELISLGSAQNVVITATSTEIQGGGGDPKLISDRLAYIRTKLQSSESDYDREHLEQRMALLSGLNSTLWVGGITTEGRQHLKRQVREALGACSLSLQSGYVKAAASLLARLVAAESNDDFDYRRSAAHRIMKAGLEAPLRALVRNAGGDESAVLAAVQRGGIFDGRQCRVVESSTSLLKDAVELIAGAVSIASSTTATFLRTGSWSPSNRMDDEEGERPA